jgi:hypothetical protein
MTWDIRLEYQSTSSRASAFSIGRTACSFGLLDKPNGKSLEIHSRPLDSGGMVHCGGRAKSWTASPTRMSPTPELEGERRSPGKQVV